MSKTILRNIFAALCAVFLSFTAMFISGCEQNALTRTFFAADTVCTITICGKNESALDGAVKLCHSLANLMDANNENSELYNLNKNKLLKNPNTDLFNVIKLAKEYAEKSNGVFDPTVRSFTKLWDFTSDTIPNVNELQKAAQYVGFEKLTIVENEIILSDGAEIELGAIAKGYISQKVCEYLKNEKITSAIINLGGNVTLLGNNNNEKFSVGIQKPFENGSIAIIFAEDCSVVTSGTYQRYIEKDGINYHHLLNSQTGLPEQNGLNSVTVISENAADADALSTLCFLLGKEKGIEYIENSADTEAVFIDDKNNIYITSGLEMNNNNINIK